MKALVRCERREFEGAKRHLNSANRFFGRCPTPPEASRDAQAQRRGWRRFLDAESLYVQGRINLGLEKRKEAVGSFEKSHKIRGSERTAFQLASVATSDAEETTAGASLRARLEEARYWIDQARILDIGAVYEERLTKLEHRLDDLARPRLRPKIGEVK